MSVNQLSIPSALVSAEQQSGSIERDGTHCGPKKWQTSSFSMSFAQNLTVLKGMLSVCLCSTCPSGRSGGSLGEFGPGQMVKEFNDVVFTTGTVGKVQQHMPQEERVLGGCPCTAAAERFTGVDVWMMAGRGSRQDTVRVPPDLHHPPRRREDVSSAGCARFESRAAIQDGRPRRGRPLALPASVSTVTGRES